MNRHISYANVMSSIAVFVAIGGTAFAAVQLGRNAVKTGNIADNAVTGAKVKDGSLGPKDLSGGTGVVARMRGNATLTTAFDPKPYPVSPSSWAQRSGDLNVLYAEVKFRGPAAACGENAFNLGELEVTAKIDGVAAGSNTARLAGPGDLSMIVPFSHIYAGKAGKRTVTLEAQDTCFGNDHPTITSAKIDVVAFR